MTSTTPRAATCHRCWTCRGNGTVIDVKYERNHRDEQIKLERRVGVTRVGVGGKVGVGTRDHR